VLWASNQHLGGRTGPFGSRRRAHGVGRRARRGSPGFLACHRGGRPRTRVASGRAGSGSDAGLVQTRLWRPVRQSAGNHEDRPQASGRSGGFRPRSASGVDRCRGATGCRNTAFAWHRDPAAMMGGHFDAIVIGGGLLGCATAWMIARDGARVLLVERDQINQHASGRNAGSLHFQLEYRMIERGLEAARKAAEAMPLHLEAARLWSELPGPCGERIEAKQTGGLMIAEDARQVALLEQKTEIERAWGLDVEMLDRTEIDRIAPYLSTRVIAAAHCPVEGKADARTAAPALARAALRAGTDIRTRTEVVGIA